MLHHQLPLTMRATAMMLSALLGAATLSAGCDAAGPPSPPPEPLVLPCKRRPPILSPVTRRGAELLLDGSTFRALGGNLYYLQQIFTYGQNDPAQLAQVTGALDDVSCFSMNVVRTLAFNDTQDTAAIRSAPGRYHEAGLLGLDRAVAEAKARGLRLILMLTNNWSDYGGLDAYARWAGRAHDDFFGDPTMMGYWKEHATTLLGRVNTITGVAYRDEPAIFGWEIANELRCGSCRGGTRYVDTIRELARHLREQGATQLVLDGGEGFDDAPAAYAGLSTTSPVDGRDGASFSKLAALPELDLVSYHLYPQSWGLTRKDDVTIWIDTHERLARQAGKAAYLGEFGSDPTTDENLVERDRLRSLSYQAWLQRLFDTDGALAGLLWQVIPASRRPTADDGYGVVYGQDHRTVGVLYQWARRVAPFDGQ